MFAPDIAETKRQGRLALHRAMAVSAVYEDSNTPAGGVRITVRQHNKLSRNGRQDGGWDAEVIEGIDRLVFNDTDLAGAVTVADATPFPVEPTSGGTVTIPQYKGAKYVLEAQEPDDGPESTYWMVSHAR